MWHKIHFSFSFFLFFIALPNKITITLIDDDDVEWFGTHLKITAPCTVLDSQKKYVENDVNIHYKVPVRYELKHAIPDDELARHQAEHMKKVYQEERRRKYLQELQDMNSRRHTDNFTPSQKSPIALNRYDDFAYDLPSPSLPQLSKSPVNLPGTVARALYSFQGQSSRYSYCKLLLFPSLNK